MNEIVVAGAGVFGTSVAERLAWNRNNHVILHTIETDVMEDINTNHQNTKYFPTKFLVSLQQMTTAYFAMQRLYCWYCPPQ